MTKSASLFCSKVQSNVFWKKLQVFFVGKFVKFFLGSCSSTTFDFLKKVQSSFWRPNILAPKLFKKLRLVLLQEQVLKVGPGVFLRDSLESIDYRKNASVSLVVRHEPEGTSQEQEDPQAAAGQQGRLLIGAERVPTAAAAAIARSWRGSGGG